MISRDMLQQLGWSNELIAAIEDAQAQPVVQFAPIVSELHLSPLSEVVDSSEIDIRGEPVATTKLELVRRPKNE